ncbi:MAG TPA: J domain-containing protein [Methylomirabilota bacterium]|nr:J domain-containing protein [Methylomirabilota bacterium]
MRRDYYAVLGITATAVPREIRQAYQRLARQYSPDINFWDAAAAVLFEEIAEAYRVLSDPEARALYDRFGLAAQGLDTGRRGEDVHVTVDLEFADVARGATLRLNVPRFSPCGDCGASGRREARACPGCAGRGVRRAVEPVTVAVPPGVDSGTQVRVTAEGSAGPFGGPRGDLVVSTRVQEHPFFVRRGEGVHCEIPIGVWEALRGARVRVPTPLDDAVLVVPPGTAAGQVFRLRGQGLPRLADGTPGDLYVTVRVEMPTGLDARTDEIVRELERLLPGPSRADLARFRGGAS